MLAPFFDNAELLKDLKTRRESENFYLLCQDLPSTRSVVCYHNNIIRVGLSITPHA